MNQSAQLELDAIRGLVSGTVGMNPSLSGYVSYDTNCLGVRTVHISVEHEIPYNEEKTELGERIKSELSESVTLIINNLKAKGYSVTETSEVVCVMEQYGRLTLPIRCSLKPIVAPVQEEAVQPTGVSINVLSPM